MTLRYIVKPKANDFANEEFTYGKEYKVFADYRERPLYYPRSPDNGFVIENDKKEIVMVFLNDFEIIDSDSEGVYVFELKR